MTIALRLTERPDRITPNGRPRIRPYRSREEAAHAATHPALWRRLVDPKARRIARELAAMPPYLRRDIGLPD